MSKREKIRAESCVDLGAFGVLEDKEGLDCRVEPSTLHLSILPLDTELVSSDKTELKTLDHPGGVLTVFIVSAQRYAAPHLGCGLTSRGVVPCAALALTHTDQAEAFNE